MTLKSFFIAAFMMAYSSIANAGAPCKQMYLAPYHKMKGTWKGEYSKISPKGIVTERYKGVSTIKLREVGEACHWTRKSEYTYFGGKKKIITLKGVFSQKKNLILKQKKFVDSGKGWTNENFIFLSTIDIKGQNQVFETTILMDDQHRTRTWTHTNCKSVQKGQCLDGQTRGLTMIVESKID